MTLSITHAKVSAIQDNAVSSANGEVLPSDWNAAHTITGTVSNAQMDTMSGATIKGRASGAGAGSPQDLVMSDVLTLIGAPTTTTDNSVRRANGVFGGTKDSPVTIDDAGALGGATIDTARSNTIKVNGNILAATAGAATVTIPNSTDTLVGRATTDTLTGKTLTSPVITGNLSGDAFLDEADMASNSATKVASQRSIKSYILNNSEQSNFTPGGTGAVVRSIRSKLRDFVHVSDFGSLGATASANTTLINAAAASLGSGGRLLLPAGTYPITTLSVSAGVVLEGCGPASTVIETNQATGDVVSLALDARLSGMKLTASVSRTSGAHVVWTANGCAVEDVDVENYFIGIQIGDTASAITVAPAVRRLRTRNPVVATGTCAILANYFSNLVADDIVIAGPTAGTQPDFGFKLLRGDTAFLNKINATLHGAGLCVSTAAGHSLVGLDMASCFWDSARTVTNGSSANSAQIIPAGEVKGVKGTNIWFGFAAGCGLFVEPQGAGKVEGLYLCNPEFVGNNKGAAIRTSATKNTTVVGGRSSGNATYGLSFESATTNFSVCSHRAGPDGDFGANNYGIVVENATAANNYIITHNNLTGNTTSAIFDGGTGVTKLVEKNLT